MIQSEFLHEVGVSRMPKRTIEIVAYECNVPECATTVIYENVRLISELRPLVVAVARACHLAFYMRRDGRPKLTCGFFVECWEWIETLEEYHEFAFFSVDFKDRTLRIKSVERKAMNGKRMRRTRNLPK